MKLADSERRVEELKGEPLRHMMRRTELSDASLSSRTLPNGCEGRMKPTQLRRRRFATRMNSLTRSTELTKVEAELTKTRQQMQERGDLARRLLAEKDAELESMRATAARRRFR